MPKRRSMLIGMGALAMGSGAAFSSAAFQSAVSPTSDMRVVVGQQFNNNLRVEAGDVFRSGDGQTSFSPATSGASSVETIENLSGTSFFTNSTDELDDLGVDDLPAVGATDDYNGDLGLAVATAVNEVVTVGGETTGDLGFIQINNNTPNEHRVQIEFEEFGEDVGASTGQVSPDVVRETYSFYKENGDQISIGSGGPTGEVTVGSGEIKQIYLQVDTETYYSDIMEAADVEDSPFNEEQDTVDLVDSIKVGVLEEED